MRSTRGNQSRSRTSRLVRRFLRSDRGVTVIEFAVVGPLFLAIIGATIETALAFFAGYALDAAVIDSSRLIRLGQTAYVSSAEDYRGVLCGRLYGIFDCDGLHISVRPISSFAAFQATNPIDPATGSWTGAEVYNPPMGSGEIAMIEAYYKWPTFFNIPGLNPNPTGDGKRLLVATHVFRTEPSI